MGTPRRASVALSSPMSRSPKWKSDAASAASAPASKGVCEVLRSTGAAGSDQGNVDGRPHGAHEREIETGPRAVSIDAREQDLARTERRRFASPRDRFPPGRRTTAVDQHVPSFAVLPAPCIDREDHALAAELVRRGAQHVRRTHGRAVEADLVAPSPQQIAHVGDVRNPAADRERDRELGRHGANDVAHRVPTFDRRRDVEEHEFVGATRLVDSCEFDGIAGVGEFDEAHALDDATVLYVEAGNDAPS